MSKLESYAPKVYTASCEVLSIITTIKLQKAIIRLELVNRDNLLNN